jgi:hypothetical protein
MMSFLRVITLCTTLALGALLTGCSGNLTGFWVNGPNPAQVAGPPKAAAASAKAAPPPLAARARQACTRIGSDARTSAGAGR